MIDPNELPPTPPPSATSPDGRISVALDADWAGAAITVDCSDMADPPRSVRVVRRDADGSEVMVRGADPNMSPGGIAPAYDHEAPLGYTCTWFATWPGGAHLTGEVVLVLPDPPPGPGEVWIKSISAPGASMRCFVSAWPDETFASTTTTTEVLGRAEPVPRIGTRQAATSSITLATETPQERENMERLLGVGGPSSVLLVQTRYEYHRPDRYYIAGDVERSQGDRPAYNPVWEWTIPVTMVARPPTAGSPMRTPAATYATLPYNSWTEAGMSNPTYLDFMDG